jgi:hypothetical protein
MENPAHGGVFFCAPGRAHLLGGGSPLHARHGEVLAKGKGAPGDWGSEGSWRQSAGATNRKPMRRGGETSRQKSAKSHTCTDCRGVDPTRISVKVGAQYPGRSGDLPCATDTGRCWDGSPEVSKGLSRRQRRRPEHVTPRVGQTIVDANCGSRSLDTEGLRRGGWAEPGQSACGCGGLRGGVWTNEIGG